MGKFLIALAWLIFGQTPMLTILDEEPLNEVGLLGNVAPSRTYGYALAGNLQIDCLARVDCKSLVVDHNPLPIALDSGGKSWASSYVLDREANETRLVMPHRDIEDGHEAVGHHGNTATGCIGGNCSEDHTDRGKKHAKGADEPNDVIQTVALRGDGVAEPHRGSVGPLRAQVGGLKILGLVIAVAAASLGLIFGVLCLGLRGTILTRWWYVDAVACEIVCLGGLIAITRLI